MKAVLDTNVIISGLKTRGGVCAAILAGLTEGRFELCISNAILVEYEEVAARPSLKIAPEIAHAILTFMGRCPPVSPSAEPVGLPDPDDEVFLATAKAASADYLVTGNIRHFPGQLRRGVRVISPAEFVKLIRQ